MSVVRLCVSVCGPLYSRAYIGTSYVHVTEGVCVCVWRKLAPYQTRWSGRCTVHINDSNKSYWIVHALHPPGEPSGEYVCTVYSVH